MKRNATIDYGLLERSIANDVSVKTICTLLNMAVPTYYNRKDHDEEFKAAIARGIAQRGGAVANEVLNESNEPQKIIKRRQSKREIKPIIVANGSEDVIGKLNVNFYANGSIMMQAKDELAKDILRNLFQ